MRVKFAAMTVGDVCQIGRMMARSYGDHVLYEVVRNPYFYVDIEILPRTECTDSLTSPLSQPPVEPQKAPCRLRIDRG